MLGGLKNGNYELFVVNYQSVVAYQSFTSNVEKMMSMTSLNLGPFIFDGFHH